MYTGRLISLIVADSGVHLARDARDSCRPSLFLSFLLENRPPPPSYIYTSLSLSLFLLFPPKKGRKAVSQTGPHCRRADVVLERRANTLNLPTYCRPRIIRFAARHRFTRATFHRPSIYPSIHPSVHSSKPLEATRLGRRKGRLKGGRC